MSVVPVRNASPGNREICCAASCTAAMQGVSSVSWPHAATVSFRSSETCKKVSLRDSALVLAPVVLRISDSICPPQTSRLRSLDWWMRHTPRSTSDSARCTAQAGLPSVRRQISRASAAMRVSSRCALPMICLDEVSTPVARPLAASVTTPKPRPACACSTSCSWRARASTAVHRAAAISCVSSSRPRTSAAWRPRLNARWLRTLTRLPESTVVPGRTPGLTLRWRVRCACERVSTSVRSSLARYQVVARGAGDLRLQQGPTTRAAACAGVQCSGCATGRPGFR